VITPPPNQSSDADPPNRVARNQDWIRTIEVATQVDTRYTTLSRRHQHSMGTRLRTVPHCHHESAEEYLAEFAEHSVPNQQRRTILSKFFGVGWNEPFSVPVFLTPPV